MPTDPSRYCHGLLTLALQAAIPPARGEPFEKPRQRAHRLLSVDGPSFGLSRTDKELVLGLTSFLADHPGEFRRLREVLG
jgi:hypothetical protein